MDKPTALIVEDDAGAAQLLAELSAELGLRTQRTNSGSEAIRLAEAAQVAGTPLACAIVDLVLAESDGLAVAVSLRALQPELPIIALSGVYRQMPPELASSARPDLFLAKPFDLSALREGLRRLLGLGPPPAPDVTARGIAGGTPGTAASSGSTYVSGSRGPEKLRSHAGIRAAPPSSGQFGGRPAEPPPVGALTESIVQGRVGRRLMDLLRKRATGTLTVQDGGSARTLFVQAGSVRFAQGTLISEAAGAALVTAGTLKQAAFDRAVALARQQQLGLHEALAMSRALGPDQLRLACKQQTLEVSIGAVAATAGSIRFEPQPPEAFGSLPDVRTSPVLIVAEWGRRKVDLDEARRWLEERAGEKLGRSPELDREIFSVRAVWPGESVTALANAGRSVGEILPRLRGMEVALLYVLCSMELLTAGQPASVRLQPVSTGSRPPPPPPPSPDEIPLDEDRGKFFKPEEQEARARLFADRDRLAEATHYELLGVGPQATPEELRSAYVRAARKYHSDGFAALDLGEAQRVAEDLFARASEANRVLGSPNLKADYDILIERKAKGLPTDVGAILHAEALFQRGQALLRAGKLDEADAIFREAIALNRAEAEFHAFLGVVAIRRGGRLAEAKASLDRALQLDERQPSALVLRASLAAAQGDEAGAVRRLEALVDADPLHALALAELQRLRAKKESAPRKSSGFFGGWFRK